jgi:hypothetical protein
MAYVDFIISIFRRDDIYYDSYYSVDIRWRQSEDQVDHLDHGVISLKCFDINRLCALDPLACGRELSAGLFSDSRVLDNFKNARIAAASSQLSLRMRLLIEPSAPELHNLPWETLCDPCQDDSSMPKPLFTGQRILFSRYLTSYDWRPVRLRPQRGMRALVVIANPRDLSKYRPGGSPLAAINVGDELERAERSLRDITIERLALPGEANLDSLKAGLYRGCDILYLVCHGAFIEDEPYLWLEDKAGNSHRVAGDELASEINELLQLPRLVVLLSCQSAGGNGADALTALGPRLAKIGIPAVLAIQGKITMQTANTFLSAFFQELRRNGELDRAMAVARDGVREKLDWWMPVLFTRLHDGRIWYALGFTANQGEHWPALIANINRTRCTPIIGPDLFETLLGSRREIALRWADTYNFPLAPYHRENLPQVAQYLDTKSGPAFPREELETYLKDDISRRYEGDLEGRSRTDSEDESLDQLIQIVGKKLRERDPADPFRALAKMPIPIYISTNVTNLLQQALHEANKNPRPMISPWNEHALEFNRRYGDISVLNSRNYNYQPSVKQPLVYQLFGNLAVPESCVITEDDYFDYLIGVTRNRELIPVEVSNALINNSLLFLGFQMEDWNFRVLLRSILHLEGHMAARRHQHVAVQFAPEEGRILDPQGARRYLEQYFIGAHISIFWGQARDFLQEVSQRL